MFLSLLSSDRRRSLAPPEPDKPDPGVSMLGKRTDSVHLAAPMDTDQERQDDILAYASFPGIAITEAGRYCLKITVIDLNRQVASPTWISLANLDAVEKGAS